MNWTEFKNYLDHHIVEQEGENLIFKEEIRNKYNIASSTSSELDFTIMLNRFYRSLEVTLDNDNDFHQLPTYQANKTWARYFPVRNTISWGAKTDEAKTVAKDVFDCLGEIYQEWQNSETEEAKAEAEGKLADDLVKEAENIEKDKLMEELMAISFLANLPATKRKSEITKWEKWLTNYATLSPEKQESLKEEKEAVEKLLGYLKICEKEKHETTTSTNSPLNVDGRVIIKCCFIGLAFILGLAMITKLIKGKN